MPDLPRQPNSPRDVIRSHNSEKCQLLMNHPDTVAGHINNERALTNHHQGRVHFELTQNAADRADIHIGIRLDCERRTLTVSNDGQPLSFLNGADGKRSDFAALCSLHTSNKRPGRGIGNKGVGFTSVWEHSASVRVRSRYGAAKTPWEFRLRFPFKTEHLEGWFDQESADEIRAAFEASRLEAKHQGTAPSFYCVEELEILAWPDGDEAVTSIELENIADEGVQKLKSLLHVMASEDLIFVGDFRPGSRMFLTIEISGEPAVKKPLFVDAQQWIKIEEVVCDATGEIEAEMKRLDFDLEDSAGKSRMPRLVLAFPKDPDVRVNGLVHSYLPTADKLGAPFHLHGDFYLVESRKHVDDNRYNQILLERAVDMLLEAIETNHDGLAGQAYVLELLAANGVLSDLLMARLRGNGTRLARMFVTILGNVPPARKTKRFYRDLFSLIDRYMPKKSLLSPYLQNFCRADLRIVPVAFGSVPQVGGAFLGEEEDDLCQVEALPLPWKSDSVKLFCKVRPGALPDTTKLSGVIVTQWQFSPDRLSKAMQALDLWDEYETVPVLRAVTRAQDKTTADSARFELLRFGIELLRLDSRTTGLGEGFTATRWRFVSQVEIHPAANLLVPVEGGEWEVAQHTYLPDEDELLSKHINPMYKPIDKVACERELGPDYLGKLRGIGVWDCAPLFRKSGGWQLGLHSMPSGVGALRLLARSYAVWREAHQDLKPVIDFITNEKWLRVDSGSSCPEAPKEIFFGTAARGLPGYFLIESSRLSEIERELLRVLDIRSLKDTEEGARLVGLANRILDAAPKSGAISADVVAVYRSVLKRINSLLDGNADAVDKKELANLPLLYETEQHRRGVAMTGEIVWYVPPTQSRAKATATSQDIKWWLAIGDMGTLAGQLAPRVEVLRGRQELCIQGDAAEDVESYVWLQEHLLPMFLAFAVHAGPAELSDDEVEKIRLRWQRLSIKEIDAATLFDIVDELKKTVPTHISSVGALWESVTLERSRKLVLYVRKGWDIKAQPSQLYLCRWFAEEVFRLRALRVYFERLMTGASLEEYGIAPSALADAEQSVRGWMPETTLDAFLAALRELTQMPVTSSNWRDNALYQTSPMTFPEIQEALSRRFSGQTHLADFLAQLNPKQANLERFDRFVDECREQIAALPDEKQADPGAWKARLERDPECLQFNFDPEEWFLQQVGMTTEAFARLAGSLTGMQKELRREKEVDDPRVDGEPEEVGFSAGAPAGSGAATGGLAKTQDDRERAEKQMNKSRSGKRIEKEVAIRAAQKAARLDTAATDAFLNLIEKEYRRLKISDRFPSARPVTERDWLKLLHIGDIGDGAGYDVIDYDPARQQLLLIEVKSSRHNPLEIHFSETERRKILELHEPEFLRANPLLKWRLYFVTAERYVDLSEPFLRMLQAHNEQLAGVSMNPVPENWVLRNIAIDAPKSCEAAAISAIASVA